MMRFLVLLAIVSAVTACNTEPRVSENRVSEHRFLIGHDERSAVAVLGSDPTLRVIAVKMPDQTFCAEPPPDAAENTARALAVSLSQNPANAAEIEHATASYVKQLFRRSQGIELYRDGMFTLCNAMVNKFVEPAEFGKIQHDLLKSAEWLITEEILHPIPVPPDDCTAPSASASGSKPQSSTSMGSGGEATAKPAAKVVAGPDAGRNK